LNGRVDELFDELALEILLTGTLLSPVRTYGACDEMTHGQEELLSSNLQGFGLSGFEVL
jgi:hypothetical protein